MRILFFHGHTQTGFVFERKTVRLREHIQRAYPGSTFFFPTGPIAYKVSDRLDYLSDIQRERSENFKDPDLIETHAWFRLFEDDPPRGLLESLDIAAEILRREGPFDGVICFSQGSVVGSMMASLLEGPRRRQRFDEYAASFPGAVQYPESYKNLNHPPLKFGITYGAYMGTNPVFNAFYSEPLIETPFLHFMGEFDPVVPSEMVAAVDRAQIGGSRRRKVMHPGAHAIPVGDRYHEAVVDFIRSACEASPAYFDLTSDDVPLLSYNDTPEQTPFQTPLLTPSLSSAVSTTLIPSPEATILPTRRLDQWKKSRSARRSIRPRSTRRTAFSGRRSTSSSAASSAASQHSDDSEATRTPASSTSTVQTVAPTVTKETDLAVRVVEVDSIVPGSEYEGEGWQELLLSDLLNEMLRRHGRPGRFYFVPDEENDRLENGMRLN
ncbi:serine hydrolase-domain-containing protein [Aspergillus nidulans var. acristatus]